VFVEVESFIWARSSKNNYSIYKLAIEKKSKTQPNCEKKYNRIVKTN